MSRYLTLAGRLTVVMLLVSLAAACRPTDSLLEGGGSTANSLRPITLKVIHTSDTWGYYDPCG